jgi:hypothetical protein
MSKSCQKVVKKFSKKCQKLSKSCQKVAKKLSKSCQKGCQKVAKVVKKLSRIGCESKIVDHVLFINKVWGGWGGWGGRAKRGSKAFGNYFVVSRRQKGRAIIKRVFNFKQIKQLKIRKNVKIEFFVGLVISQKIFLILYFFQDSISIYVGLSFMWHLCHFYTPRGSQYRAIQSYLRS